ncbi:MAG: flagellar export chaperone FlgN [Deltaproteobacteria bacterium]|nr:flagellar export chaperone FlgN [Deltaproteobacteria bacterium]
MLEKLVALHRNLVELLREEYVHMGAADLKGIGETAHAKEVLLGEIWNLEQLRISSTEKLAGSFAIAKEDATLALIADRLPRAEGDKLRIIRKALNLLCEQAKEANVRNMSFAESSLERIETLKRNVLGISNTATKENYSNAGTRQPIADQGGRLLSTEA